MANENPEQPNNGSIPSTPPEQNGDKRNPDGTFAEGNKGGPGRTPEVSITAAIKRKLLEKYPVDPCFCDCHKPGAKDEDGERTTPNSQSESCPACTQKHEEIAEERKNQKTYLDKIVSAVFQNGIVKLDQRALKDVWSYIDGLPKGSFDLGVDREGLAELTEFMKALAKPDGPTGPKSS